MELIEWTACGRIIGKASGWDQVDNWAIVLYDFEPGEGYSGPLSKDITIFYESGLIEIYNDEGVVLQSKDLISSIKNCPRKIP